MNLRLAVLLPLLFVATAAWALPGTNVTHAWAADQDVAANWYILRPHTWGWIMAALSWGLVGLAAWWPRTPSTAETSWDGVEDLSPKRHWLGVIGIVVASLVFYLPLLRGEFAIYDDPQNLWNNPLVTETTWENFWGSLFNNPRSTNQEVMYFSLFIDWALFGRWYPGFFLTNLAVFPIGLLAAHHIAWRLTGNRWVALLSVLFLVMTPHHVEMMAWQLARGHYYGWIATLTATALWAEANHRNKVTGSWRWPWLIGVMFCYLVALGSKPIFVFLPAWLMILDLVQGRRAWLWMILDKIPPTLLAVAFAKKAASAHASRGHLTWEWVGGTASNTIATDMNFLLEYLRSAIFPMPTGLHISYNAAASWIETTGIPNIWTFGFPPVASLLILASWWALAMLFAVKFRWGWGVVAFATVIPTYVTVMNIPAHTVVFAYRYALSTTSWTAFLLAVATVSLYAWAKRTGKISPMVAVVFATLWLGRGAWVLNEQRYAWESQERLWTRSAEDLYPKDGLSLYYAAKSIQTKGNKYQALGYLHRSLEQWPHNDMVYKRLGDVSWAIGDLETRRWYETYFGKPKHRKELSATYETRLASLGATDFVNFRGSVPPLPKTLSIKLESVELGAAAPGPKSLELGDGTQVLDLELAPEVVRGGQARLRLDLVQSGDQASQVEIEWWEVDGLHPALSGRYSLTDDKTPAGLRYHLDVAVPQAFGPGMYLMAMKFLDKAAKPVEAKPYTRGRIHVGFIEVLRTDEVARDAPEAPVVTAPAVTLDVIGAIVDPTVPDLARWPLTGAPALAVWADKLPEPGALKAWKEEGGVVALAAGTREVPNADVDGLKAAAAEAGIALAGVGTAAAACEPAVIEVSGLKVAVVSVSLQNGKNAAGRSPGACHVAGTRLKETLGVRLQRARKDADVVLLVAQWNVANDRVTGEAEREVARTLANLDVDAILGVGGGIVQGMEWIDGVPVIYDLGHAFTASDAHKDTNRGLMLRLGLEAGKVTAVTALPLETNNKSASLAQGNEAYLGLQRFVNQSRLLGSWVDGLAAAEAPPESGRPGPQASLTLWARPENPLAKAAQCKVPLPSAGRVQKSTQVPVTTQVDKDLDPD